jgi:hypothetical protein
MTSVPTGSLGEADFKLHKVPLAESLDYLFEVSHTPKAQGSRQSIPIQSPVPTVSHFITRLNPAYHKHHRRLHTFLGKAISQARAKAQQMGADAAVELADNTLDMMVARELRGDDFMPDRDMRDELVVCEWSEFVGRIRIRAQFTDLLAGTETSATTLAWVRSQDLIFLCVLLTHLVGQVHDESSRDPAQASRAPARPPSAASGPGSEI